jgi:DNA-binding NarL/FixJ family response regulator
VDSDDDRDTPDAGEHVCPVCGEAFTAQQERFRREHRLTPRQLEVVRCAAGGSSSTEIASHLGVSPRTIEGHLQAAYDKLGVHTRIRLALVFHAVGDGSTGEPV